MALEAVPDSRELLDSELPSHLGLLLGAPSDKRTRCTSRARHMTTGPRLFPFSRYRLLYVESLWSVPISTVRLQTSHSQCSRHKHPVQVVGTLHANANRAQLFRRAQLSLLSHTRDYLPYSEGTSNFDAPTRRTLYRLKLQVNNIVDVRFHRG